MKRLFSVIVTTYDRPDALVVVLDALARQTDQDFEVIVADDGSGEATRTAIGSCQMAFVGRLRHVWRAHQDFRAGEIRNRGVLASSGSYCIFLDGDCIPRRDFIAQHRRLAAPNCFVTGNRTLLSADLTHQVLRDGQRAGEWPLPTLLRHLSRNNINRIAPMLRLPLGPLRRLRAGQWRGARSCNLAIWRNDLDLVDGFDTEFVGWGREDSDLVVRLTHAGVKRRDGAFATGVLHLWHPPAEQSHVPLNDDMLASVIAAKAVAARRGLKALRSEADAALSNELSEAG
ncbi:MAG: glycosyltransferase family 2 protein [Proteobacteria bacterium]|nr:glycosyltransferase family 2 protein [Pseudomonadota bacterium]